MLVRYVQINKMKITTFNKLVDLLALITGNEIKQHRSATMELQFMVLGKTNELDKREDYRNLRPNRGPNKTIFFSIHTIYK